MKLDKDTYLLAQDIYLRAVTNPAYKGNDSQTAVSAIRSSVVFFEQWDAMEAQVKVAANNALQDAKPIKVESLSAGIKKANGERQKLPEAPAPKQHRKASAKARKTPVKPLRKRKGKR
jgi:hypothetical protein